MPVTRIDDFTNLGKNGGFIDVDHMSKSLSDGFSAHGISRAELLRIAGRDHTIRGAREFKILFDRVFQPGAAAASQRGGLFEALEREVEANRARALKEGGLRFAGNPVLDRVAAGRTSLRRTTPDSADARDATLRIQQALIDMGYLDARHGATGAYDIDTKLAVMRFQRDAGLVFDGIIGQDTLSALISTAPPPGQVLQRSAEYDQLYADGRLDVTIALGCLSSHEIDAGGEADDERALLSGLRAQGYSPLDPASMGEAERARFGLSPDRYDPHARYFARTFTDPQSGRDVLTVVRFITQAEGADNARASFKKAIAEDEIVMHFGDAGPEATAEADAPPPAGLRAPGRNRSAPASKPPYQVVVFNGSGISDPSVFQGGALTDTDVIATARSTHLGASSAHALRFLQGFTSREPNSAMLSANSRIEEDYLRAIRLEGAIPAPEYTYSESGFLGNSSNTFTTRARAQ